MCLLSNFCRRVDPGAVAAAAATDRDEGIGRDEFATEDGVGEGRPLSVEG